MTIYLHKNHVLYIHPNRALELTHELDQPGLAASSLSHNDHGDVTSVMYTVHLHYSLLLSALHFSLIMSNLAPF